jgi:hypothetical protein
MKGNSNCCDAPMILGQCQDCGEEAEARKFDCEICEDTGTVTANGRDNDGNWQQGVDEVKCECQYEHDSERAEEEINS